MSGNALIVKPDSAASTGPGSRCPVDPAWVPGQGQLQIPETAASGHKRFSCKHLLCRTSIKHYRSRKLPFLHFCFHTQSCSHRGRSQKIVATAVTVSIFHHRFLMVCCLLAHLRKGIVFSQKADHRASVSPDCPKRRWNTSGSALHLESLLLQKLCHQSGSYGLLKRLLRIFPDLLCQSFQSFSFTADFSRKNFSVHCRLPQPAATLMHFPLKSPVHHGKPDKMYLQTAP